MANAKYVSKLCGYDIPLGPVRYDMHQANLTIKWRKSAFGRPVNSQTAYVLDETDIDIPDIPKYRPTAKRVYLSGYPAHDILEKDWLGFGDPSPYGLDFLNEWMLKGDCYVLDEC